MLDDPEGCGCPLSHRDDFEAVIFWAEGDRRYNVIDNQRFPWGE